MTINLGLSFAALVPRCIKTPATAFCNSNLVAPPNFPQLYGGPRLPESKNAGSASEPGSQQGSEQAVPWRLRIG